MLHDAHRERVRNTRDPICRGPFDSAIVYPTGVFRVVLVQLRDGIQHCEAFSQHDVINYLAHAVPTEPHTLVSGNASLHSFIIAYATQCSGCRGVSAIVHIA